MAELNETPRGNRIHIAFFGLRNAGKSTLVNAFTGQSLAIVSEVAGTTTDPVSKAMEILPLGPCLITDTAGLDDVGELGKLRVEKTLKVLETTDVAVWVWGDEVRDQRSEFRGQRSEVRGQRSEVRDQRLEVRGQSSEFRGQRLEVRGQSSEVRDQSSEVRDQRLEVRGQRSEVRQRTDHPQSDLERWTFDLFQKFLAECKRRRATVLEYRRGDSVEELKGKIAALRLADRQPDLLDGLVSAGDRVICVIPIDESAPKGRLILPQQQVLRECLDRHLVCTVCQPEELSDCLTVGLFDLRGRLLVITDSQAFGVVSETIRQSDSPTISLTSFSILFARQKGDLNAYTKGLEALQSLRDGDTVLVAEGCTHHRQCNDIGSVKIPKALEKLTGRKLKFVFSSGVDFALKGQRSETLPALVVQCGGCMLTRREVLGRISLAQKAGVPIVNYGLLLGFAAGITTSRDNPALCSLHPL